MTTGGFASVAGLQNKELMPVFEFEINFTSANVQKFDNNFLVKIIIFVH